MVKWYQVQGINFIIAEYEKYNKIGLFSFGIFALGAIASLTYNYYIAEKGFEIGFPFRFYLMFKAKGNDYYNYSLEKTNILLDILISGILGIVCYFFIGKSKK